jgi:tRNA-binding EMAP/Myf-like protein
VTNEEIKANAYKLVSAFLEQAKPKPAAKDLEALKIAVDLGINFLQNINDIARKG